MDRDQREGLKTFGWFAVSFLAATLPWMAFAAWAGTSGASPWWLLAMPFLALWTTACLAPCLRYFG
jgi:hypothetical protein